MANQYNPKTNANIQALFTALATAIGNGFEADFSFSPGFSMTLAVSDDGQSLAVTAKAGPGRANPSNPNGFGVAGGGPNNPFYAADSGPGVPNPSTHLTTGPAFVVDGSLITG